MELPEWVPFAAVGASVLVIVILVAVLVVIKRKLSDYQHRSKVANQELGKITEKYSDIIDVDTAVVRRTKEYEELTAKYNSLDGDFDKKKNILNSDYQQKHEMYEKLVAEISILEENLEFTAVGIYKPHFDFETSERYKQALQDVRAKQKQLIKGKNAVVCRTDWTVEGSKQKGRRMTNQYIKLMLRAFNGECDAAVLKVRWDNVDRMEARILKAFEMINKYGTTQDILIQREYFDLKLAELRIAHEYADEKEEQRRIREEMREEGRAQKELEKATRDAEDEERRYARALEKARRDVAKAKGAELNALNEQILELEKQVKEAGEQKSRAISRAQLTKSGHVYVISNIGSFGRGVFKIGMTRRLEPLDRVKELGDASVPFAFDVHAMIFSENAPALETKLHQEFVEMRVNMVNKRKEFFRVNLDDIEEVVAKERSDYEFVKTITAQDYHETMAILAERKQDEKPEAEAAFPSSLI